MSENLTDHAARESRSLSIAMAGMLFMCVAGVAAGVAANSKAIMMDGLFSLIGFGSALLGRRVSRRLGNAPDKFRPMGYAAEESLFTTFRALTVVGLIVFALSMAVMTIYAYVAHGQVSELVFWPIFVYFAGISLTCLTLWAIHYRNWVKTGRRSDILRLEAKAAVFDGVLTAIAGAGLIGIYFLRDTPLAPIVPIGDALVLLLLCVAVVGHFWKDFMAGLGELAGATAKPEAVAIARRAARRVLAGAQGRVRDFAVMKFGRSHLVCVYYTPGGAILASEVDSLQQRLTEAIRQELQGADVMLIISERPRSR